MSDAARIRLGAVLVALLHPVTVSLLHGVPAAAPPVTTSLGDWSRFAAALAHLGDAFAVVVHPASWPALAITGQAVLSPVVSACVVGGVLCAAAGGYLARSAWLALGLSVASVFVGTTSPASRAVFGAAAAATAFALVESAARTLQRPTTVAIGAVALVVTGTLHFSASWQGQDRFVRAALAAAPADARVRVAVADADAARGDARAELESLRVALSLDPSDAAVRQRVGEAYASRATWDEAERHLVKVALVEASSAADDLAAADAAARAGRWPRARLLAAKVAQKFDSNVATGSLSTGLLVELARQLAERDPASSARLYAQARAGLDANARLAREHGEVLAAAGRRDEAVAALSEAVSVDPGDVDAAIDLAWLLAAAERADASHLARALELARRAVEQRPGDAAAFDTLAVAEAASGDYPAAVDSAARALELGRPLGDLEWMDAVDARREGYRHGRPYREFSDARNLGPRAQVR